MKRRIIRPLLTLAWVSILMCVGYSLSGCGSGTSEQSQGKPPDACSLAINRPNACGDLIAWTYFAHPVIRYRICSPAQATDIHLAPIAAIPATNGQQDAIHEGFRKWQAALNASADPRAHRTIREWTDADAAEPNALPDIDVVVQIPGAFSVGGGEVQAGETETYGQNIGVTHQVQRSVIRLRTDADSRRFKYFALHEAGHSLGMEGHSKRLGDIMYPVVILSVPLVELKERDVNTIRAVYSR